MDLAQSVILGAVQGITEFLPISSTAHLALFPWFLSWQDPGLAFDVALHVGTLFAVFYYFWSDWKRIILNFLKALPKGGFKNNPDGKIGAFIILATIPGALSGYLLEDLAGGALRHPAAIAFSVFIFGLALYIADKISAKKRSMEEMTIGDCLVMGVFQAIAIIPGVSRSGITITGGLLKNLRREEAARFSFLISAPLILGAIVFQGRHLSAELIASAPFVAGIASSAIFGLLSIKYLMKFVQKQSYTVFFVYRTALAALILIVYFFRGAAT
ncbi:MAG: undecaprenyl-diphosphate phosphatase [Deltaproteobacteria bacterium]